jgi:hypothetical protein
VVVADPDRILENAMNVVSSPYSIITELHERL